MARNGGGTITVPNVLTIPFTVYVRGRLSAEIDSDVEPVTVTMILSRKRLDTRWYIDSVDLEQLRLMLPGLWQRGNSARMTLEPVIRKAATILKERGIDPGSVKGWTRVLPPDLTRRVLYG
jgi:hypothetical protein